MSEQFMAYLVAADAALCSAVTVNVPLHHNQVRHDNLYTGRAQRPRRGSRIGELAS